ncbi:hypothetical protein TNCV_3625551 [Trichonephila clavipes]|nr:hypothetical protein TNCV_3625551 [Trichonephila clavipes]
MSRLDHPRYTGYSIVTMVCRFPDLSSNENTWLWVAEKLVQLPFPAYSFDEVWHRLKVALDELPVSVIHEQFDSSGRGSLMVQVTDSYTVCLEFKPTTTEDPPCREAMHVKLVKSSNILPLVFW